MGPHEVVVDQVRVGLVDAVDFFALAGAESFGWIETPNTSEEALAAQDFVNTGDAAGEAVRSVEDGGVRVR